MVSVTNDGDASKSLTVGQDPLSGREGGIPCGYSSLETDDLPNALRHYNLFTECCFALGNA